MIYQKLETIINYIVFSFEQMLQINGISTNCIKKLSQSLSLSLSLTLTLTLSLSLLPFFLSFSVIGFVVLICVCVLCMYV